MYSQNASHEDYGQQFAHKTTQASTNVIDFEDPAKVKILKCVLNAFEEEKIPEDQPGLRIDDVCDLSGFKEGFVRDRLGELVESKLLNCIPGAGRRPSYYFPFDSEFNESGEWLTPLPPEPPTISAPPPKIPTQKISDDDCLRMLCQRKQVLLASLEKVDADIQAINRTIQIKQDLSNEN